MTCIEASIDLSTHFSPEVHEIKTNPALKRGLKRTFFRLDPSQKRGDQRVVFLIQGLIALDGILFNIRKVYRDSWVKISSPTLIANQSIVDEIAQDKGLGTRQQAEEVIVHSLGSSPAYLHTSQDLQREVRVIKTGLSPFLSELRTAWDDRIVDRLQQVFFDVLENIYEDFHKNKISRRNEMFRSVKSLWISSFYEVSHLMNSGISEIVALEYSQKVAEKKDSWNRLHHSLGLALYTLKAPVSASLMSQLSTPSDLFKFLSLEMSYQITTNPKSMDLVVCLDEKNTPLYCGIIVDPAVKTVRYFITGIKEEGKNPLFLDGGDVLQPSETVTNFVSMGHHYALMMNVPIHTVFSDEVTRMVFFEKRK
jgi:hypothetical protein